MGVPLSFMGAALKTPAQPVNLMMSEGGEKVACPEVQAVRESNAKKLPGRSAEGPRHPG